MVPSDYFLFRYLKKALAETPIQSDTHIQADVSSWLEGQDPNFYLASLPAKWNKCIELKGDYIEKNNKTDLSVLHHIYVDNFLSAPRIIVCW